MALCLAEAFIFKVVGNDNINQRSSVILTHLPSFSNVDSLLVTD